MTADKEKIWDNDFINRHVYVYLRLSTTKPQVIIMTTCSIRKKIKEKVTLTLKACFHFGLKFRYSLKKCYRFYKRNINKKVI